MTVKDVNSGSRSNLGGNNQQQQNSSRANNTQRPKNIQQWSVVDVQKWLRRHCGDYYHLYAESFLEQEVSNSLISKWTVCLTDHCFRSLADVWSE